jgi:hypothetical protein
MLFIEVKMLEKHVIRDFAQHEYSYQEFLKQIEKYNSLGRKVYIGTDSQSFKEHVSVVTSICLHSAGSGGKLFYIKEKISVENFPSLRSRMLFEAYRSIEVAMELEEYVSEDLEIHLDVGSTIKSKTSSYQNELQAIVNSQGYKCAIKPYSWASSSVADRMSKS